VFPGRGWKAEAGVGAALSPKMNEQSFILILTYRPGMQLSRKIFQKIFHGNFWEILRAENLLTFNLKSSAVAIQKYSG
jgi:hypothetical protein